MILNGSYDIGFTMALVLKDLGLFQEVADRAGAKLEVSPLLDGIFRDGEDRYGPDAWSSKIVKRHEDDNGADLRADGFPPELVDVEPEQAGAEVALPGGA